MIKIVEGEQRLKNGATVGNNKIVGQTIRDALSQQLTNQAQKKALLHIAKSFPQLGISYQDDLINIDPSLLFMTIGGQSLSQALEETIHQADKLTRRHIQKLAVLLPLQQDGTHFYDPLQRDKRSLAAKIPEQNTTSYRKEKIREAMRPLNLQSHRMEHVATLKGVDYINDSLSTNRNSLRYALSSVDTPIILIIGGQHNEQTKNIPREVIDEMKEKVKGLICLSSNPTYRQKLLAPYGIENTKASNDMKDAIQQATLLSDRGDTILLSPAAASFDLFKDHTHRGKEFIEQVHNL